MIDLDALLVEVSYRLPDGLIDFTIKEHRELLRSILIDEYGHDPADTNIIIEKLESSAELLAEKESKAVKQAHKLGLASIGYGKWVKKGDENKPNRVTVAITKGDKLIPVTPTQSKTIGKKPKTSQPTSDKEKALKKSLKPEKSPEKTPPKAAATDVTKSDVFNEPLSPDKDFYARSKGILASKTPFRGILSVVKTAYFPKKYASVVERMMNVQAVGDASKISYFTDGGGAGAGTTQSKAGELAAMMFVTMNDKEFDTLYPKMLAHAESAEKNGKKAALDSSWIKAAANARNSTLQRFRKQYPNSQIVGAAWDVPEEVETLGLPYKDKESSTDVFYKLRSADGKEFVDQSSLKKDFGSALINPGAGVLNKWDTNLPTDVEPGAFYDRRRLNYIKAAKTFFPKSDYVARLGDTKNKIVWKELYHKIDAEAKKGNKKAAAWIDGMNKDFQKWNGRVVNEFKRNKKLVTGVLTDISETLPIKGIVAGRESITIGNVSLDKFTAGKIFGTNDFNLIKTRLVVVTPKDKTPHLAYKAGKDTANLPLATVRLKDESGRYSINAKFIMDWHKDFAKSIQAAHKKVYGQIV